MSDRLPLPREPFASFFMAGFECSTQRRRDGRRLDLTASTQHDDRAVEDYRLCADHGMRSIRDGLRWHLIETAPGRYDWSSWRPMLEAAETAGVQVIWDLCHYGWPDFIDLWSPDFVERFAAFAEAAAKVWREHSDSAPLWCPINEISFLTWSAGDVGYFHPAQHGRGVELKRQLVRAATAGAKAVRKVDPRSRLLWAEPLINVTRTWDQTLHDRADAVHVGQYEALDMLGGLREPELGGRADFLDLIGINYYPHNQWYIEGPTIPMGHHAYRDLSELLVEAHTRYGRPLLISETGSERGARAPWLHYACEEVRLAQAAGVDVLALCLYPILAYPGWDNDRLCEAGLFHTTSAGQRAVFDPLDKELKRQGALFAQAQPVRDAPAQPMLQASPREIGLV